MRTPNFTVLELTIKLKYEWEHLDRRDLARMMREISRWRKVGKYGGKVISILIVTNETAQGLMDRIRPGFDAITVIDDVWCQTAGSDAVGRHGSLCPFATAVSLAWEEARKRNYPKKMPNPRTKNVWLDHGVDYFNRKNAIKMGLKPRGKRQPQKNSTTDRDQ